MKKTLHAFYSDLALNHGWNKIIPLLDVISAVEAEIQSRGLTAFTSHEILRISPHFKHPDWFKDDMLYIMPERSGMARVLYVSREEHKNIGVMDFYEGGGINVPYTELVSAIIPHLDRLAQRRSD